MSHLMRLQVILMAVLVMALGLLPGPGLAAQEAALQGQVRDSATGEPLAGVQVLAMGEINGDILDFWEITNNDGNYRLEMPAGEYLVSFLRDDAEQRVFRVQLRPGEEVGRDVELDVFDEVGEIQGILSAGGEPLPHRSFFVEATRDGDGERFVRSPVTGEEGQFHFFLPPGDYRLEFSVDEWDEVQAEAIIVAGETVRLDIDREDTPVKPALRLWPGSRQAEMDGEVREELGQDEIPFIEEGRTFVPMRFIGEALGAGVDYTTREDGLVDRVILEKGTVTVEIVIGEDVLQVVEAGDSREVEFDAPARIRDGRTFLPFRAVGEAFGMEVDYGVGADGRVKWVSYTHPE